MPLDLRAKRLAQSQLKTLVPQDCQFGIKAFSTLSFLGFGILLTGILGLITGFFGGKLLTDIIFDYQGIRYLSVGFFTVVLLCIVRLKQHGILATLAQAIATSFIWISLLSLFLITAGWLRNPAEMIIGGILLNALDAGFAVLSTVCFAILCQVVEQALPKQYLALRSFFLILTAAISAIVAAQLSHAGALDNDTVGALRQRVNPPVGSLESAVLGAWVWAGLIGIGGTSLSDAMTRSTARFLWLKQACTAIAAWRGTSFYNLDLSHLNFSGANIANCDLRAKVLYRTCFMGAAGLARARVDRRYLDLDLPKVQRLLTHTSADEKDFQRVNLQGVFLQRADLQRINLTEATLHGAMLQGANLRGALFIRTVVKGVDFSGADLTGCCIKDWSTNRDTDFTGVICSYIFCDFDQTGPIDRYPRDRDFQPGEFAALHRQFDNSVELVFAGEPNLRALDLALAKFKLEDNGLGLELQGIEPRGEIYVVKVAYRDGVSPQQVQQKMYNTYNIFVQSEKSAAYNVVQQIGDIMEKQNISAGGNVDASSGARVSIGGDVTGSTLNLGTISGNVTNLIQQIRDSSIQGSQDFAKLLDELQNTIQSEEQLSDPQKQEALEAVATIAEEAKKLPEHRVTKMCTMAMNALAGIATTLTDASKLAEMTKSALPVLRSWLGI